MRSVHIIVGACITFWIIHWTSDAFPGGIIPLAFTASFLGMNLLGFFKNESPTLKEEIDNQASGISARQKEFRDSLKEIPVEPDAVLHMVNQDGVESKIIIKSNGEMTTEGEPDPDILEAAKQLQGSIKQFGVESIAAQLAQQIAKMDKQNSAEDKE